MVWWGACAWVSWLAESQHAWPRPVVHTVDQPCLSVLPLIRHPPCLCLLMLLGFLHLHSHFLHAMDGKLCQVLCLHIAEHVNWTQRIEDVNWTQRNASYVGKTEDRQAGNAGFSLQALSFSLADNEMKLQHVLGDGCMSYVWSMEYELTSCCCMCLLWCW